jgi:NADPH:quinone reductase-like Zn-dependent oxidoreductase
MSIIGKIPKTQRAWRVLRRGHPSKALEFAQNAPVRTDLADGEVLVKVGAAALNPVCVNTLSFAPYDIEDDPRSYHFMEILPNFIARRPYDAAELDLAGTVVLSKSALHSPGDKVFGWIEATVQMKTKQGSLAEYTIVPGEYLVPRPAGMSATDCAGVTLTSQTAYMAIMEVAGLQEGQTVFVNGGSSSVGAYAIQIAKAKGMKVWASASGKNEEFVRSLGVDEVSKSSSFSFQQSLIQMTQFLDYTKEPLEQALSRNPPSPKFHAIFDAVGLLSPGLYTHSEAYLAPGGIFVTSGSVPKMTLQGMITQMKLAWSIFLHPRFLGGTPRKYTFVALNLKHERLEAVAALLAEGTSVLFHMFRKCNADHARSFAGKVKPVIDSVHDFENVLDAYARIMSGRAVGKVVVNINPDA